MVGSSPLILLNDLIITSNRDLPADMQMQPFSLFSVTPIGLALIVTGILYFVLFGRWVLPKIDEGNAGAKSQTLKNYLKRMYELEADVYEVIVPEGHECEGQTFDDIMKRDHIYIIGSFHKV